MGVDIDQYFLVGLKLDTDKYGDKLLTDEIYDNDYKLDNYLSIVYDGMNGKYLFIGHSIEVVDEYDDLDFFNSGFSFLLKKHKKELKKAKKEIEKYLFEEDIELLKNIDLFYIKRYH